MTELLLFMMLGQTLASLPQLQPGTEVRVVSTDLLVVHASGTVEGGELRFEGSLEGAGDVRVFIYPPDGSAGQSAPGAQGNDITVITGQVSPDGQDILLALDGQEEPLSFRGWLQGERGLELRIPR